jgi:acid phosphatase type 7
MRNLILGFVCLILLGRPHLSAQSVTRGPYLQNANHNAITVKWRTDSLTDSKLRFGPSPGNLTRVVSDTTPTYDHTLRISGLWPDSTYYYVAGSSTTDLEGDDSNHYFHTNPIPGTVRPIKIWALGDFGRGNAQEVWVRNSYQRYADSIRQADAWIWLGDNAYDTGADSQYTQRVFNVYDSVFDHQVFWPTPGNHDYYSVNASSLPPFHTGPYYSIIEVPTQGEAGGVPSGGEMYYSFDYGNVHLISLNSELGSWIFSNNTPLIQWLEADLQANTQPWTIVYFHQPPHTKSSHNSDNFWENNMIAMRVNIMPIVEQYGVDLVLAGHSHAYERSKLMYGFYNWSWLYAPIYEVDGSSGNAQLGEEYHKALSGPNGNLGTVYAVVGNGGSTFSFPALNHPIMYTGWGCDTCVGSLMIDVHDDTLRGQYLSSAGVIRDEFTILKDLTIAVPPPLEEDLAFTVYPNPFSHELELSFTLGRAAKVNVQISSMSGIQLYETQVGKRNAGEHRIVLNDVAGRLPAGMYLFQLTDGVKTLTQRVVKL